MKYRDYKVGFTFEAPDHLSEVREASYEVFGVEEGTLKHFIVLDDDGEIVRSLSINCDEKVVKTQDEFLQAVRTSVDEFERVGLRKVMNDTLTTPSGREIERYIFCDVDQPEDIGILIYFTKVKDKLVVSSTYVTEFFDVYETELYNIFDSIQEL